MAAAQSTSLPDAALIEARDLAVGFGGTPVVSGIGMQICVGDRWGFIGPNGAGKTTLVRTLMGMLPPVSGELARRSSLRFGYVKQRDTLHDLYPFTVLEVVRMGRYRGVSPLRGARPADREAVDAALERTGIADLRNRPVRDLSGGQKQRVLIARALCAEPDVILLDEPTNDMDIAGEEAVLSLIEDVHRQTGAAVVMVSHLLHAVLRIADRVLFLGGERVGVYSKAEFIAESHLERFYGIPIRIHAHPDGSYSVAAARHFEGESGGPGC